MWRAYVSGGPRPGPIDNAHLLEADADGIYVAREGLEKAEDYRAVNDSVWAYFQKVYGGGPTLPREKVDIYSYSHWDIAPKSAEQQTRIERVMDQRGSGGLPAQACDPEIRQQIIDAMLPVVVNEGEVLMRQGEEAADFFIIEEGECSMEVTQQKGKKLFSRSLAAMEVPLGVDDTFGHMSIDEPWGNNVTATTDGQLWCLRRSVYNKIIDLYTKRAQKHIKSFLKAKVELLNASSGAVIDNVTQSLEMATYQVGDIIAPLAGEKSFGFVMEGALPPLPPPSPCCPGLRPVSPTALELGAQQGQWVTHNTRAHELTLDTTAAATTTAVAGLLPLLLLLLLLRTSNWAGELAVIGEKSEKPDKTQQSRTGGGYFGEAAFGSTIVKHAPVHRCLPTPPSSSSCCCCCCCCWVATQSQCLKPSHDSTRANI
eukprot:COSAG05_NODE_899_length_6679_cov_4.328419_1_plen_428_part_00